jgi:hypothetical protein
MMPDLESDDGEFEAAVRAEVAVFKQMDSEDRVRWVMDRLAHESDFGRKLTAREAHMFAEGFLAGVTRRKSTFPQEALPPLREPDPDAPVVYFFRRGDLVKIGTTRRGVERRLNAIRSATGDVSTHLVAVIPDASYAEESRLHKMFAASRVKGEWFTSTPELEALIESFRVA